MSGHPVNMCENCGALSPQRCGRCKAFFICSRECMKAVWRRHKPDCDKIVAATEYLKSIGDEGSGVPCMISAGDKLLLDNRCLAVYQKYGYQLFLDILRENDTCSGIKTDHAGVVSR
ncbi:uncharacterized protein PITG_02382 [Phytophthora infestans T30-4]|uniref:MYND-type domain-containing protein n=1 Tax=Phytophthora infestans (strain T30-4) TaxID=403677 RepID=D0MW70_PHYIT|nr:uncharacterized protein PITG_02382 [Phytophthora infestans T30-4]EEY63883.1 conserved hypothetical protein [Phytophthora infestans T30-4]|eukprot:XP_002907319.1 conserved hypothetical protein [Phytophthora infestans T30-4]